MNTPICDFVKKYADSKNLRLHMPGHKGNRFLGMEHLDITEIDGADVLYHSDGIIKESERNASLLFGTKKTLYSTEGSSLSIRAMLYLCVIYAKALGRRPFIAAGRNAHKTFMTAAMLLDIDIEWLFSKESQNVISCQITGDELDNILDNMKEKPVAVYITSPDYLGNISDIEQLAKVCKKHNTLFIVDNAHGAYLNFLQNPAHPIALGADMCCDSAHKTLPVLTGGAYLHISKNAPSLIVDHAEAAMSLFASTSPSYLILQSLDMANKYLFEDYPRTLSDFKEKIDILRKSLEEAGFSLIGNEPLKLTIATKSFGYTGYEFAEILSSYNIVCEFFDRDFLVMMLTPEIGLSGLDKIKNVLTQIERKNPISEELPTCHLPKKIMSVRDALLSPSEELNIEACHGKVLASANVACPPAIPIIICGEQIDDQAIRCFKYYGITSCRVVDV